MSRTTSHARRPREGRPCTRTGGGLCSSLVSSAERGSQVRLPVFHSAGLELPGLQARLFFTSCFSLPRTSGGCFLGSPSLSSSEIVLLEQVKIDLLCQTPLCLSRMAASAFPYLSSFRGLPNAHTEKEIPTACYVWPVSIPVRSRARGRPGARTSGWHHSHATTTFVYFFLFCPSVGTVKRFRTPGMWPGLVPTSSNSCRSVCCCLALFSSFILFLRLLLGPTCDSCL